MSIRNGPTAATESLRLFLRGGVRATFLRILASPAPARAPRLAPSRTTVERNLQDQYLRYRGDECLPSATA